ncbi:MAG TPA: homocysteine biosynthesis protein [Bacillota bacterium]|nr:hypothetical protein [Candidatus Fermentithermobacillaceae bacterium]HOB31065.1 homocysteine biosynthesis protein [Bacillota bacterium]HOK64902.1 homocysteine biosynthesis protein [Bacillota bacterium]HOL12449.1 homocysteine biosynthesis protein [Bacillota bacterium]HOQ03448.1 homocysteine biosynthesis protein [Bacillota bacterium]
MVKKTYEEINEKIKRGEAVVVTAEEVIGVVQDMGIKEATRKIDVVTTATFAPMCSSGAFLNFGHSDPPMRMTHVELNGVPAYAGIAAVDAYIGATELRSDGVLNYGGAHVIEDLVKGNTVSLRACSYATDCYPRTYIEADVSKDTLNQCYLFNPRNAYQNYGAATNSSSRTLYTYMGKLKPSYGNVTYCTAGELSPLLNDPYYRTIGIGTRVFIGGGQGFVAWEGTQHNPSVLRTERGVPIGGAGSLALIGDIKPMKPRYVRAASIPRYGVTLLLGVGIPIPILDEEMMYFSSVTNEDIWTYIYDYSVAKRERPVVARTNYKELRSGIITIDGREVPTVPLSSLSMAREIAQTLKTWVSQGEFPIGPPVQLLPLEREPHVLEPKGEEGDYVSEGLQAIDATTGPSWVPN